MPHKIGSLHICDGAVVDVVIWICRAEANRRNALGNPLPAREPAKASVDTGASRTCIDSGILRNLGLTPIRVEQVLIPSGGGSSPRNVCMVDFSMSEDGWTRAWSPLEVYEADLSGAGYKVLSGKDVLANCLFVYDGKQKTFALSF